MFVLEQEEYVREGIEWDFVNFGLDLQPTIDLIESRDPIGILSLLDEECIMPKATDLTFTEKLHHLWNAPQHSENLSSPAHPGSSKYSTNPMRLGQAFILQHYAGKVEYATKGWLEKNKDPLNDNLTRVLSASAERYVAQLFLEFADSGEGAGLLKKRVKKGAFRTVGQRHKEQLSSLMTQLQATQPHFVRCIVPNTLKKPGRVDVPLVLDQLRCNGVLEGIRIARLGYPNRLPFAEFRQHYEVLTPGIIPKGYMDGRKATTRMVDALELDPLTFKIGTSKIFFKAGVLADLEERRDALLFDVFSRLQAVARMFTARRQMKKILNRAIAVRTIQRNARVYGELREWPWWQLYTKVRPLLSATRNDEELRRKEVELALVREKAERDKREKATLEGLKMQLEKEKHKVEEELEAERLLTLDKDRLLERSKKREGELEEDVAALQADLDTLDSQLERAIVAQQASEQKYTALKRAFDEAADHLVRLEKEEKEWKGKESRFKAEGNKREQEWEDLVFRQAELEKELEELTDTLSQKDEDLSRIKDRMDGTVGELEDKLNAEIKLRYELRIVSLRTYLN
jgi:myosin protein heavy chain